MVEHWALAEVAWKVAMRAISKAEMLGIFLAVLMVD
jgi:hypothetical protein